MEQNFKYCCPICGMPQEAKSVIQIIENNMGSHVASKIGIKCACGHKSLIRIYPYEVKKEG